MARPRITVVTPSFNQGRFIARTIDSVREQQYPNLEHIVVDGMSTDDTPAILARYPHLRILREPDRGQADAINKGFRLATGDIFCFLNSDDTLLPGALDRVAREIDPARGRHIVMGRCRHIDEEDRVLPLEHPSAYLGHRRVLEVWKVHSIPQPATFWTAEVWRRCGPLDDSEQMVLDFDLFCRFSRHYSFHFIDQVLATYRLHEQSKTCTRDDEAVLRQAIGVSRNYWGPVWRPFYWRLFGSLALWRLERFLSRKHWAAALLDGCDRARQDGNLLLALAYLAGAAGCAPELVVRRELLPRVGRYLDRWLRRDADLWRPDRTAPATLAWRGFTGRHNNGCIGPLYVTRLRCGPGRQALEVQLDSVSRAMPWPITVELFLDEVSVFRRRLTKLEHLTIRVPLAADGPGEHELKIACDSYLVPHEILGNGDYRPLSAQLRSVRLVEDTTNDSAAEVTRAA